MKKKEKWIEIVVTVLLTICGLFTLGYIVRPTDTDGAYSQIETFHRLPDDSIEVMIYGSSHAFRGVDPMVMYEDYGIGAYNYSWHWQRINTTRLFIEDSLKTQKPKVMLVECYRSGEVLKDTDITAEIYYSRYIKNKEALKSYLDQCFNGKLERYVSFYCPLYAFHANWGNVTAESFKRLSIDPDLRNRMGFYFSEDVTEVKIPDYRKFEQKELEADAVKVLDDIVRMCKENDIDLIFFTVPYDEPYEYGEAMKTYAEKNGCVYLDYFEKMNEIGLDETTDFSDSGHLNRYGAAKVSDDLGRFIAEHYDVTDMRKISGNLWIREQD